MAEFIPFSNNYTDRSTDTGFQFEFHCDRCGDGVRSSFQASATGTVSTVLDAASNLFGGFFNAASTVGRVRDVTWQRSHDAAFRRASDEVMSNFTRCSRCTHYVCQRCWNEQFDLCADCAPDMAGELAVTRTQAAIEQMREKVYASAQFSGDISAKSVRCPACGAPAGDMKFCGECGTSLALRRCANGHDVANGMKFCGECGGKVV